MSESKHYHNGVAAMKDGKLDVAMKHFERAITEDEHNPIYYSERGVLFYHMGKKEKALDDMNRSVELEPDYSYRYSSRAWIKDAMGDIHGAIEDYKTAIQLDPEDAIAHNNLGLLQEKLGYIKDANANYSKADDLADVPERARRKENPQEDTAAITENTPEESDSKKEVIKKTLTSKRGFREYLRFIRNGFRIKD